MNANELFHATREALDIVRGSFWNDPADPLLSHRIVFLADGDTGGHWAILPAGTAEGPPQPIDPLVAQVIIKDQLRNWLTGRGWQVQVYLYRRTVQWRLADCLSVTDGGGDRLDADYPAGDDELAVLCRSVLVVR